MALADTEYFSFDCLSDSYAGGGYLWFAPTRMTRPVLTWRSAFDAPRYERGELKAFAILGSEAYYAGLDRERLTFDFGYLSIEKGKHPDGVYEAFRLDLETFMTAEGNAGPLTVKLLYTVVPHSARVERHDARARFVGRYAFGLRPADHSWLFQTQDFLSAAGRAREPKLRTRRRSLVDRVLRRGV